MSNINEDRQEKIYIEVLGERRILSSGLVFYNEYRKKYAQMAEEAVCKFKVYFDEYSSLGNLVNNASKDMWKCVYPAIEESVRLLIQEGIFDIDGTKFYKDNERKLGYWKTAYDKVKAKHDAIDEREAELDRYRVERRENRDRAVGMGFGVGGYVEAQMKAGAINMATGAGHMAVNAVGKVFSSMAASNDKNEIFHDPGTKKMLLSGVYWSVFECCGVLLSYLDRYDKDDEGAWREYKQCVDSQEKTLRIINNVQKIEDVSRRKNALVDALLEYPYHDEWYKYVLATFGDSDGSLEKTADFFGISVIHDEKASLMCNFIDHLDIDISSEEAALKTKNAIEGYRDKIKYGGDLSEIEKFVEIEKALAEFRIAPILSKVNYDDTASIEAAIKSISAYIKVVADPHNDKLRDAWKSLRFKQEGVKLKSIIESVNYDDIDSLAEKGENMCASIDKLRNDFFKSIENIGSRLCLFDDGTAENYAAGLKEGWDSLESHIESKKIVELIKGANDLSSIELAKKKVSVFPRKTAGSYIGNLHKEWKRVRLEQESAKIQTLIDSIDYNDLESISDSKKIFAESIKNTNDAFLASIEDIGNILTLRDAEETRNFKRDLCNKWNETKNELERKKIEEIISHVDERDVSSLENTQKAILPFSDEAAREYREKLQGITNALKFEGEHKKAIKTAIIMTRLSIALLLLIIIGSYCFTISTNESIFPKKGQIFSVPLIVQGHELVEAPKYIDGVKNGLCVFGRSFGDTVVVAFQNYIDGFDGGWIWKICWATIGLVWVILKQLVAVIPRYFISVFTLLFQKAKIGYYPGFIFASALPFILLSMLSMIGRKCEIQNEKTLKRAVQTVKRLPRIIIFLLVFAALSALFMFVLENNSLFSAKTSQTTSVENEVKDSGAAATVTNGESDNVGHQPDKEESSGSSQAAGIESEVKDSNTEASGSANNESDNVGSQQDKEEVTESSQAASVENEDKESGSAATGAADSEYDADNWPGEEETSGSSQAAGVENEVKDSGAAATVTNDESDNAGSQPVKEEISSGKQEDVVPGRIVGTNVRLRNEPSLQGYQKALLSNVDVTVFKNKKTERDGHTWYYVETEKGSGWVSGQFLSF
ncbi:MAG: hypothetical protein IKT09_05795 [Synergistes sp.]|nr:hypothetical protein [Synergistes sp.]